MMEGGANSWPREKGKKERKKRGGGGGGEQYMTRCGAKKRLNGTLI